MNGTPFLNSFHYFNIWTLQENNFHKITKYATFPTVKSQPNKINFFDNWKMSAM